MVALLSGITPEQYLEQERKAEFKSEYVNGRVYAMGRCNAEHNTIAVNIGAELRLQFKGRSSRVYTSEMRVKIEDTGKYTYPDVAAICGNARFEDTHVDTLLNPTVLVEVLSPSTEAYDRGGKFAHYRRLPSVQEYVLVSQNQALVEKYTRQGEQWVLTEYAGLDAVLDLPVIGCRIPLTEIYDKVELDSDSTFGGGNNGNA
jgi:Uma2 family endonuclease